MLVLGVGVIVICVAGLYVGALDSRDCVAAIIAVAIGWAGLRFLHAPLMCYLAPPFAVCVYLLFRADVAGSNISTPPR